LPESAPNPGFLPKTGIQTLEDYNPPDDPKWVKTPKPTPKASKGAQKSQMWSKVPNRVGKEKRTQCAYNVRPEAGFPSCRRERSGLFPNYFIPVFAPAAQKIKNTLILF